MYQKRIGLVCDKDGLLFVRETAEIRSENIVCARKECIEEFVGVCSLGCPFSIGCGSHVNISDTQAQIADLKEAIKMLEGQIRDHTEVLKSTLVSLNKARGIKKRKTLMERSNAVTAALLTLETMYRSLQASFMFRIIFHKQVLIRVLGRLVKACRRRR